MISALLLSIVKEFIVDVWESSDKTCPGPRPNTWDEILVRTVSCGTVGVGMLIM